MCSILKAHFNREAHIVAASRLRALRTRSAASSAAEKIGEDVAEGALEVRSAVHPAEASKTALTAAETAGRIRIYAGLAETVVGCALLLIGEHGICLTHLFELRLSGFIAGVAIRVVLHGKATIRFLDLVLRCPALNAEHLIVVLFSHGLLLVFRMNETLIRFLYVEKEPLDRIPPLLRQAS